MPKILIADSLYPEFLGSWKFGGGTPEEERDRLLEFSFGTSNFYSRSLRALGWEAEDYIMKCEPLRGTLRMTDPDVVFMQDLSMAPPVSTKNRILAGQCSCALPPEDKLRDYDVIFTSLPNHVDRLEKMGIRAVYLPLAFDPIVLDRVGPLPTERIHDVVFVGGVGRHWKRGNAVLEAVAQEIPTFQWFGYGLDSLRPDSPLRAKYRGPAFGLDYYRILLQSKIAVCRHGEVAEGFANCLKLYEYTGCGSLLLTEAASNLSELFRADQFVPYSSAADAVFHIKYYLAHDEERNRIAANGQQRTLRDHTYQSRMQTVSEVLTGMLTAA